jgi:prophage antirepressor-like protein
MPNKIKGILDEELQEGETEQAFSRHSFPSHSFSGSLVDKPGPNLKRAMEIAAAKKQKETLPVPAVPSNDIQVWYRNLTLRTYKEPNPENNAISESINWFCLADVCKTLGYKDSDQARKTHCLGETITHKPEGSTKKLCYIGESDLYNLILRSNSPVAIPFRKFVTQKVLPALRRDGRYFQTKEEEMEERQEAKEALSSKGVQLEMFPITAKPSLTFQPAAVDALAAARKKLLENNKTFNTYSDFLGYLIKIGLEQIGVAGFEFSGVAK